MKANIQIVSVVQHAGRSKKTGNDYDMRMGQCVVRQTDPAGATKVQIGVLSLPDRYKDLTKGVYEVDFDIAVLQNSRIGAEVYNIVPWSASSTSDVSGCVSTVDVLDVVPMSGFSKKSMREYDMRLAQCLVHKVDRATGDVSELVGELLLPERFKDIKPGRYSVSFEVAISREKRIGAQVADIVPVAPVAPVGARVQSSASPVPVPAASKGN